MRPLGARRVLAQHAHGSLPALGPRLLPALPSAMEWSSTQSIKIPYPERTDPLIGFRQEGALMDQSLNRAVRRRNQTAAITAGDQPEEKEPAGKNSE